MEEIFKTFFDFDLPGEVIMSLIVMGIILLLCVVIFILVKKADPLKKPKGLLGIFEMAVDKVDSLVDDNMGKGFENYGGYILTLAMFIIFCFIIGITGLPNPLTYLGVPLSLALITFVLIHATSIKYTKWSYFKRYVDPIPAFLPVNLIGMWAPLLSMTLRLFGNAFAGMVLMSLVYGALKSFGDFIFSVGPGGSIIFAPLITPVLHAYFDLFSGAIQTLVFMFLTMLFIAQEKPEEYKMEEELSLPNSNRR